jgi:hypothetical protein
MPSTIEAPVVTGNAPRDGAPPPADVRGIAELRVRGFRSIVDLTYAPGLLCALVGEARAGKSNLLAAANVLLDPSATLAAADETTLVERPIVLEAALQTGERLRLDASGSRISRTGEPPPVLFLPASERAASLVAGEPADPLASRALGVLRAALDEQRGAEAVSDALPAASLVDGLEHCCVLGIRGLVLLIEEPELYLRPQAQRYLYRLLRTFARGGNQVLYSTHSPNLLNVARLDELAFVSRGEGGTHVLHPEPLSPDEDFRVLTEFDAARSELFLARAALLVEGQTERLALPFAFAACGYDVDREGVSIVECGGKANILLFGRVCRAADVPFIAVFDRDRGDEVLNDAILDLAGRERSVVLAPDFEHVAKLHGRRHKPERAWRSFAGMSRAELPQQLQHAVEKVVALARGGETKGETR